MSGIQGIDTSHEVGLSSSLFQKKRNQIKNIDDFSKYFKRYIARIVRNIPDTYIPSDQNDNVDKGSSDYLLKEIVKKVQNLLGNDIVIKSLLGEPNFSNDCHLEGHIADLLKIVSTIEIPKNPINIESSKYEYTYLELENIPVFELGFPKDRLESPRDLSFIASRLESAMDRLYDKYSKGVEVETLKYHALRDPKLDIWDSDAFELKKNELANSKISSLSMVMIDFDKFKNKNDTYGHEVGDIILKGVIRILKEECGDCIYRIGGDEFVIVFEGYHSSDVYETCNAIKIILDQMKFDCHSHGYLKQTLSMGLGTSTDIKNMSDVMLLLRKADYSMYESKNTERLGSHITIFSENINVQNRFEESLKNPKKVQGSRINQHR